MTKWQQKKFSKLISDYKLDERDAGLPLEKKFTTAEIEAIVLKCSGMTHDILALLDTTQSQWAAYLKRRPDIAEIQKQAREAVVDRAEAKMLQCVDSDNEAIA